MRIRSLFQADPRRFERFSLEANGLLLDYSKNAVTSETIRLLTTLARKAGVKARIEAMFRGKAINATEDRPALHVALRNLKGNRIVVDGKDVMPAVRAVHRRMGQFVRLVHEKRWRGYRGTAITDVVNLGIGGSQLGPMMAHRALTPFHRPGLRVHFVSNVDSSHLVDTLSDLDPARTLFIVTSKSFGTQETLQNARSAIAWLLASGAREADIAKHFVAVSGNRAAPQRLGIPRKNVFELPDWVGGRFSLWSAVGLPVALAIGMKRFDELLAGAHEVDQHFRSAPFDRNMPVLLALIGIWYNNFWGASAQAYLPYDQHLVFLPAYLQQLEMESNGKRTTRRGSLVTYDTCPIVMGETGTVAQHSFYQLLHQGTRLLPADFIGGITPYAKLPGHHELLLAHFFAQTEALMVGKDRQAVRKELRDRGLPDDRVERLLPHRVFPGERPTNTILYQSLDPRTLGALLATYEHKTFVQGVVWDINSFDQWGVELGKELADRVLVELADDTPVRGHDASTRGLINYFKARRPKTSAAGLGAASARVVQRKARR